MNNEDSIFYGISPHYDPFRIVNCHVCNKIISLTFFRDHLVKKHEMCLANGRNEEEEIVVRVVDDEDDEVALINRDDDRRQRGKLCKTANGKKALTPKPPATITPSPSTSTESQGSGKQFVVGGKVNGCGQQSKMFNPDRHCGVAANVDGSKPCMRSLTCKKHPILLKRQVEGRSKSFNDLFKKFRDEKIQQHVQSVEVKLEDIVKPSSVAVLPPPTPPPSTSQFEIKSESTTTDSPSSPLATPLDESTLVYDYNDDDDDDDDDNSYSSFFQRPKPIAVCTYGARYLDYEATEFLVWNRRQDHFRSVLSCAFDERLMPTTSSCSSSVSKVSVQTPSQPVAPKPRKTKPNLKPIVITLPSIKVEEETLKPSKSQQAKVAIKRSSSLNVKASNTKTPKLEPTSSMPSPIILTSSPQQPLQTITMTPTKAFILPNTTASRTPTPTTSSIKFIQSVPKSTTQLTPIITANGVKRTLITSSSKKPQTIVPKTSIITATPSPQQSPSITKTTKISPKTTNEYIILNGNHHSSPMRNGSVINKLTLISTPTTSVVTTPTKSINLIQTPSTIKITKRCIDSISPSPSNDSYLAATATPGTPFNNSPKYIKLSHNSSTIGGSAASSTTNSPSTLILTPVATMSPQAATAASTTTTVLKTPIAKLKIPLTTNILNK